MLLFKDLKFKSYSFKKSNISNLEIYILSKKILKFIYIYSPSFHVIFFYLQKQNGILSFKLTEYIK